MLSCCIERKRAMFALIWTIWLDHNLCISHDKYLSFHLTWDKIVLLASLWCSVNGLFSVVSVADLQRDWKIFCYVNFEFARFCL